MNERAKQLAEQAGFQYIKDEGIGWAGNYNASLPKFAELIVRECMSLVSEPGPDMNDTERGILAQIKEHFGVKE